MNAADSLVDRLTVSDYYRMGEVGILHSDARVELIEGEIIDSPNTAARCTRRAFRARAGRYGRARQRRLLQVRPPGARRCVVDR
jgi:hypothetical protein